MEHIEQRSVSSSQQLNSKKQTRQLQKTIITCLLPNCLLSKLQNTNHPSSLNSGSSKFLSLSLKSFTSMEYAHARAHAHTHSHTHKTIHTVSGTGAAFVNHQTHL
jgi:hypothetical protein